MDSTADSRPTKRNARLAGLLYLLSSATFGFNVLYVLPTLIVPGNAASTAQNILASEMLFRLGIVSEMIAGFDLESQCSRNRILDT